MTVVNFRTLVSSCIPVSSEPCRPSTSFGAAGVSSHPLQDVSVGRVITLSSPRVSPGVANVSSVPLHNVSADEVVASSSHQASTRVADLSSVRVVDESGVMATSSPLAGNQIPPGGTDLISQKRDRSGE